MEEATTRKEQANSVNCSLMGTATRKVTELLTYLPIDNTVVSTTISGGENGRSILSWRTNFRLAPQMYFGVSRCKLDNV